MTLERAEQLNKWFLYRSLMGTVKVHEVPTYLQAQYIIHAHKQKEKSNTIPDKKAKQTAIKRHEAKERYQRFFA